jgi:hypothetical protein
MLYLDHQLGADPRSGRECRINGLDLKVSNMSVLIVPVCIHF